MFGDQFLYFFAIILERCRETDNFFESENVKQDGQNGDTSLLNSTKHLTQTDLIWMKEILEAIESSKEMPKYPLSIGPRLPITRRLEELCRANQTISQPQGQDLEREIIRICDESLRKWGVKPKQFKT